MTSQQLDGDHLSMIDEAVIRYHAKGEDFIALLDQHLNFRAPEEKYVYSGPDCLVLARVEENEEHGRYWYVAYAASKNKQPIKQFLELAPYKLDSVCFSRYRHMTKDSPEINKFYKWDQIERHMNNGKQTKTTTTSSTTSSTTPATRSSSEAADQAGD
jgi:hypothetical protein